MILSACALATRSAITGLLARAPHPHHWSAGCARERGCKAGVSPHTADIARSNSLPRIQRVCLVYFVRGVCAVELTVMPPVPQWRLQRGRDPGNARPGAAASVGVFNRLRESEFTACLCMRADFVMPANRAIKRKVRCVCFLRPCFLCAWTISVTGCHVGRDKQAPSRLFAAPSWVFACTHAHTLGYERM